MKYCMAVSRHPFLEKMSEQDFSKFFQEETKAMQGLVSVNNGDCEGFLFYTLKDGVQLQCRIPVWGIGAAGKNAVKTTAYLFQYLAEKIVRSKTVAFSVHLYAYDLEIQKLFSFMQFGIQSEVGIRCIKDTWPVGGYNVREIGKNELEQRWKEVWSLLDRLIDQLRQSPVFYRCSEFTEELYRDFFIDAGTRVYIAENAGQIIGLIESNQENLSMLFPGERAANVGEAYVLPEYRGKNAAQALLSYMDSRLLEENVKYEWLVHGTANPTARGFWNKYFETFEYELIRNIEPL